MKLHGECDFCGEDGAWEGGLFDKRKEARTRPRDWAAMFPYNKPTLPKGCNFSPDSLEKHGIETRMACPNCYR